MKFLIFVIACSLIACANKPSEADLLSKMRAKNEVRAQEQSAYLKSLREVGVEELKVAAEKQAADRLALFKKMGVDPNAPIRGGGGLGMAPAESLSDSLRADQMLHTAQMQVLAIEAQTRAIESAARSASMSAWRDY